MFGTVLGIKEVRRSELGATHKEQTVCPGEHRINGELEDCVKGGQVGGRGCHQRLVLCGAWFRNWELSLLHSGLGECILGVKECFSW